MGEKKRVLIVEDDNIVRSSLERLLGEADIEIESAASGEEGLEKFTDSHHDLILTDLKLPGIDGIDMVSRMRQMDNDLPFIVLSAYGAGDDVLRAMDLGAVQYCRKPFDAQRILDLTRDFINKQVSSDKLDLEILSAKQKASEEAMSKETALKSNSNVTISSNVQGLLKLLAPFVSIGRQGTGVTHNLNSPLTGIMGHVELMKMKHPDLGNDLEVIMDLTRKLRDSIAEIQSKYENETIREPQLLNVNHILRKELSYLKTDLFFKHYVKLEIEFADSIPSIKGVYADLALSFEEILMNAIDAQRDQSEAKIKVRTFLEGENVCVEIVDEGPGFSPEALEHAFDPFWPEFREFEDGSVRVGLGLFSAANWLQPYGGTIELSNCQPNGACVKVTIPIKNKK